MKKVYVVAGGVSKFAKQRQEFTFQRLVKEAFDYAIKDLGLKPKQAIELIDSAVSSYFSDHFLRQLMGGAMVQDYLGLCPKSTVRVEGGGSTGGLCVQEAWKNIASGVSDICLAYGFETMSHVLTWKGNEFIALASDVNFDFPAGGFYSGYYAMMVVRHMKEFGTTPEQMALVSVKNHINALHNPYAQQGMKITVKDVRNSEMIAWPLTRLDICAMSDGAACCILASEEGLEKILKITGKLPPRVEIIGIGSGIDAMRMADRPHCSFEEFQKKYALLREKEGYSNYRYYDELWSKGFRYPGVHSFRSGRMAAKMAYKMAGICDPKREIDFIELHDAYTSSEIQTYEDLGLCAYGKGGEFVESGAPFLKKIDYELELDLPVKGLIPVNPSGGLLACGHPVGATGLMQAVFALWQLQGTIKKHFGNDILQVKNAKRGLIHSHAGTGTYVAVSILERRE